MDELCEVGNSISDTETKKDLHSDQVQNKKRLWDDNY